MPFLPHAAGGDHVLACRARDDAGGVQPLDAQETWNRQGMGGNAVQRLAATVQDGAGVAATGGAVSDQGGRPRCQASTPAERDQPGAAVKHTRVVVRGVRRGDRAGRPEVFTTRRLRRRKTRNGDGAEARAVRAKLPGL